MIKIKSTDREVIKAELHKYSLDEVIDTLAEYIAGDETPKIVISQEQFVKYFRLRGTQFGNDAELKVERRGRPRNHKED